jgi:hypothetical protein
VVMHPPVSTSILRTYGGSYASNIDLIGGLTAVFKCLSLCILSAILLGILYLFFGAFPLVFGNNHGFSISQTGLAFLGLLVGMLGGISTDPIWRRIYGRLVRQREQQGGEPGGSEPEFRLPSTIVGAWVVPIALFGTLPHPQSLDIAQVSNCDYAGFGWTTYSSVSEHPDGMEASIANTPASAGSLDRYDSMPHIVES